MKKRIGIVGGGQLEKMTAFEAKKMGFAVTVLDPTSNSPAGQVSDWQILAEYNDKKALRELAKRSDVITVDVEVTDEDGLQSILEEIEKKGTPIQPSPKTYKIIQDKLKQKIFLKENNIPTPEFLEVETLEDIKNVGKKFGYPLMLKARTGAYDGRGNALIKKESEIFSGMKKLKERNLYVERFVPFIKELAVMVARNTKGEIKTYPVVETIHKNNICHIVYAPAPIDRKISEKARKLAMKVVEKLKGAGVFGIEMFLTKNGEVLVNEIAPRVHNSGHYTIEGTVTSQFEQHIRAITGLPLGSTEILKPSVMINILGEREGKAEVKGLEKALAIDGVSVHIYGKEQTKIERKMGHITAIDDSLEKAYKKAVKARELITI